jgi:undecaprenyl diphosphate synthase
MPSMSQDQHQKNPRHVAIIMDGNGRWAASRGLPRTAGHKQGIEALRRAVSAAQDFGIDYLTIYAFSTENWSRPVMEVTFLLELLKRFIRQDVAELHTKGVRIKVIGAREKLDKGIVTLLKDAETLTQNNSGLTLIVAFNYGSKHELVDAFKQVAERVQAGQLQAADITAETIDAALYTAQFPHPDLLIRTGGEMRISNFLLWQLAYAEFVFVRENWPDFDATIFSRAIEDYRSRERRFGGLAVQSA